MGKNLATRAYYLFGIRILGDFGATIAVPAVLTTMFGAWLDARWGTKPYATFGALAFSFAVTAFLISRKAVAYGKEYQRLVDRHDHPADRR